MPLPAARHRISRHVVLRHVVRSSPVRREEHDALELDALARKPGTRDTGSGKRPSAGKGSRRARTSEAGKSPSRTQLEAVLQKAT
jgi:hypothetical protein